MRVTVNQLRRIIKEAVQISLLENQQDEDDLRNKVSKLIKTCEEALKCLDKPGRAKPTPDEMPVIREALNDLKYGLPVIFKGIETAGIKNVERHVFDLNSVTNEVIDEAYADLEKGSPKERALGVVNFSKSVLRKISDKIKIGR
jgi:hypothetical protein